LDTVKSTEGGEKKRGSGGGRAGRPKRLRKPVGTVFLNWWLQSIKEAWRAKGRKQSRTTEAEKFCKQNKKLRQGEDKGIAKWKALNSGSSKRDKPALKKVSRNVTTRIFRRGEHKNPSEQRKKGLGQNYLVPLSLRGKAWRHQAQWEKAGKKKKRRIRSGTRSSGGTSREKGGTFAPSGTTGLPDLETKKYGWGRKREGIWKKKKRGALINGEKGETGKERKAKQGI